jgi:hypothetical protein
MTMDRSVPCREQSFIVSCYNAGTNGAIGANDGVRLTTATVGSVHKYLVNLPGTAAAVTGAFGVAVSSAATGAFCDVVIFGPATMVANGAITSKAQVMLVGGTAGVRGRCALATAATAGAVGVWRSKVIGWAMHPVSAAAREITVFVNTVPQMVK